MPFLFACGIFKWPFWGILAPKWAGGGEKRAKKEKIDAYVHGPLAFDNAISPEAAAIKNISNEVAGKADILLVPNLETGNALSKIMVYFMGACAAGFIVGGKVPVVVTSRADSSASRIASIAASVIAAQ